MDTVEVLPGIEIADLALYLKKENVVVIGDVHLGYEDAMSKQGIFLPRFQFRDTVDRLEKILSSLRPQGISVGEKLEAVVINGDLKHEFGSISDQEWRDILKLIDLLLEHAQQVIIVRGNHDIKLSPIARKRSIVVVENISINDTFICHGHEVPASKEFRESKIVIVGNEHPAISVREGPRSELYKCFLLGRWDGKKMVVMPSFNQITIGTDILKEKFISPFMQQNLGSFEVFAVADKPYHLGKVAEAKGL
ncbi:metallophosphoesterase [Candidatus Woesearchaeota archaeon]|nr:metallophosphoesterase [Candidatus Woesearchaeota archaeon]